MRNKVMTNLLAGQLKIAKEINTKMVNNSLLVDVMSKSSNVLFNQICSQISAKVNIQIGSKINSVKI
jgi:hypothetical protein